MSPAPKSETQVVPEKLDFYTLRGEIAQHYNPVGPIEVMLVTQIVQAWLCLHQAYDIQRRYFQANDILEALAKQFEQYKAVNREVANCERAWRHAVLHLEKMQRQRQRGDRQPSPIPQPGADALPEYSQASVSSVNSGASGQLRPATDRVGSPAIAKSCPPTELRNEQPHSDGVDSNELHRRHPIPSIAG